MAHLAEDTAVRRGDTLDGAHGAVRVPRDIHGRITVQIGVLERYLTVLNQVVNDVLRRYEATLTVRERDGMQVTDVAGGQPRALHRGYASGGVAALVAADEVEGQRRVVAGHLVTDFAVGNQTQLNERLEAVADAEHQAVALVQQLVNAVLDACITQEGRNELTGTVRLVTAGEAARQDNHLRLADRVLELLCALTEGIRGEVADNDDLSRAACILDRTGGVVLAVGAREYRNNSQRLCTLDRRSGNIALGEGNLGQMLVGSSCLGREYALELAFKGSRQLVKRYGLTGNRDLLVIGGVADQPVSREFGCGFDQDAAKVLEVQRVRREGIVHLKADLVAERHLANTLGNTAGGQRPRGNRLAGRNQVCNLVPHELERGVIRRAVLIVRCIEEVNRMTCRLELRRDEAGSVLRCDCEGNQRGRYVHIVKRAGHGVLAADSREAQIFLCGVRAEQSGQRFAETLRVLAETLEIFLEGEVCGLKVTAGSNQLGYRLDYRGGCTEIRVLLGEVGVKAECHDRGGFALTVQCRHGSRHDLRRGQLILAAEGHEYRACADGAVETLDQTALEADAEGRGVVQQLFLLGIACRSTGDRRSRQCANLCVNVLGAAIGVEEITGNIHDFNTVPGHAQAVLVGNGGYDNSLDILLGRSRNERIDVLCADNDSHALLRLGDGQLGAVQTVVLLRYGIQVDVKAVGQLANGNRNTTRAEVVAAADHAGDIAVTEQTLNLALLRRIALLDLSTAGLKGLLSVLLRGAGSAAAAVTAGFAAEQDDDVARLGYLADNVLQRSRTDNSADLHALCDIARVVDLVYEAGRKTDLVAVGGIACSSGLAQLALRQLVLKGLRQRHGRVARTGHAHRLINVGAAGQRITDRTAEAGSRAAERLDLGRVVVGFVLEHEQPVLVVTVHERLYLNGAGVDLLRLVDVLQVAALLEHLSRDRTHVHQRYRTLRSLFLAVDFYAGSHVAVKCVLHHLIFELYVIDLGEEGGVAAVVGPVSIDHANLGDGRVALFGVAEVGLQELEVVQIHRQTHIMQQVRESRLVHVSKADNRCHAGRDSVLYLEGCRLSHRSLAGVHGVDQVAANLVHVLSGEFAFQNVDFSSGNGRAFAAGEQLDALCAGIGALIELTGQRLYRKDGVSAFRTGKVLVVAHISHRLGEYDALCLLVGLRCKSLCVIAAEIAHMSQVFDFQQVVQAGEQAACFDIEAVFFLGITTIDAHDRVRSFIA